jgi:peptidylprolyl isomerase
MSAWRRTVRGVVAAAIAVGCVGAAAAPAPEVVARMGSAELSAEDLRGWIDSLPNAERAALKDPAQLALAVRNELARRVVVREAVARKYDQSRAVKAQLARVRDQALAELYLQSISQPPPGFPSEAEVRAEYEAHLAAFAVPRQFRVAQIFISEAKGADEGRRRAEELARRARAKDADFAALARAESEEGGAKTGSELGWLTEDQLVPGIRATVTALHKDQVADPVRLDDGWHVVKLLDLKPASIREFPEVRETLAARLRAERTQALRREYVGKLVEKNPPAVNELALSRVLSGER